MKQSELARQGGQLKTVGNFFDMLLDNTVSSERILKIRGNLLKIDIFKKLAQILLKAVPTIYL